MARAATRLDQRTVPHSHPAAWPKPLHRAWQRRNRASASTHPIQQGSQRARLRRSKRPSASIHLVLPGTVFYTLSRRNQIGYKVIVRSPSGWFSTALARDVLEIGYGALAILVPLLLFLLGLRALA